MKIDFMMTLIAIGFFTIVGLTGAGYYNDREAINAGLQQCREGADILWKKECN